MSLAPGTRLGTYETVFPLGAGETGEVDCARKHRLERGVVIKVLPDRLATDAQARERFRREARTIAPFFHLNILIATAPGKKGGEFCAPRCVVNLMSKLILLPVTNEIESGAFLLCNAECL